MRHAILISSLIAGTLFLGVPSAGATPPANGDSPTLSGMQTSGAVYVGSTLYAKAGRWSGVPAPTYTYRWQYQTANGNWPDIAGATDPSYTVQPGDFGYPLRVNVTATNSDGSAEQVSVATIPVTNAPDTPVTPPDPPPDALGSPLNSRVVSSDGLLITRSVSDYSSFPTTGRQGASVVTTTSGGEANPVAFNSDYSHGDGFAFQHFLPQVTATGRFLNQDFDSVLMLEDRDPPQWGTDPELLVLRSASSDSLTTDAAASSNVVGGKTYRLGSPTNVNQVVAEGLGGGAVALSDKTAPLPDNAGARSYWTAVALPAAGTGVIALVNRESGRCLSTSGATVVVAVCTWDQLPSNQQWTASVANAAQSTLTFVNGASGLALEDNGNGGLTTAAVSGAPASDQQWLAYYAPVTFGTGAGAQTGDDPPTYSFSASPATYTTAAGDLDRVSEFGDTYMYHDEAVVAWVPNGQSPTQPTVRVIDYVAGGGGRPVTTDVSAGLEAPGAVQDVQGNDEYLPGSIGLAVGDFDGDSLNEIAYVWQDEFGWFQITILKYRANADKTRSLEVVESGEATPVFYDGGTGPAPRLEPGMADTKVGDFDGDGRDDLAITYAGGSPEEQVSPYPYLGVVSFTQDLDVRGEQYTQLSNDWIFVDAAASAQRAPRLAPGLFRVDPDVGYTMERRQLAVAWTDTQDSGAWNTKVAVYSIDPADSCTQATCDLAINTLAAPKQVRSSNLSTTGGDYNLPLSFAAGGLRGRGADETPPVWGMALTVNDVGEDAGSPPDGHLYTLALNPDSGAASGFSLSVLQDVALNPNAPSTTSELYSVTAFDPAGASLVLGAPAVVQVQGLKRATMVAAQPPVHADWDWNLGNSGSTTKGGFLDVSRFSNFTVTLGSTQTSTYEHTHTTDASWNGGVSQSLDVKGSFNNDVVVEATTASVEFKEKFKNKWTGTSSKFNNSTSQTSTSVTQTSDDDDLFQGSIEDSTLYRYPIMGGPVRDANGDPVSGADCGQTCYGVYEIVVPGQTVPLATSGRQVDFYQPTWENGNALSYPVMTGGDIPTPDLGSYTYVDQNGNSQSVSGALLKQAFGVGGASSTASVDITGTTGSGNSSGGGTSWSLSGDVNASASYRMGPKAINYAGSVSVDVGGFGGQSTSTNDTGQTINTSDSAFKLNVPSITSDYGYSIGTSYYYDTAGAARIGMAVDLTSNSNSEWWADNYGRHPDPALNLPNRVTLTTNAFNQQIVPVFATDAKHQQIRGFQAFHTDVVDSPSYANKAYTTNPVAGDQVRFQVPVRNYSLIPTANVSVSFYAVPMQYQGLVPVPAGPPVSLGQPQNVPEIPAQGSALVSSPVWTAAVQQAVAGIQLWRIFVVLDEGNKITEIHEWKDSNGPCPVSALDPLAPDGTVINGVMVDPMTAKASTLACGQNNQGFGEISVSASAPANGAQGAETMSVLDLARGVEPNAPGVNLTKGGVDTDDPATDVMDAGEVAHVDQGRLVNAVAYVGSKGESPYHQTVLVYDGPPENGRLIAVTTLRGATAANGHRLGFTWRPEELGRHTLHVRLLGQVAAGDDDEITIPVVVERPKLKTINTKPEVRDDAYVMRQQRTLRMRAPGVLGNDRDAQGDKLTAVRASEPAHGSLRLNGDGSFTYKPTRQFVGTDGFTYRASDGPLASDPARVTIKVRRLPTCDGRKATIVGTGRGELIRGTRRADVIVAFGGNDRIRGRGGDDRICAGKGRDAVEGGAGRDRVMGDAGADRLQGGDDADMLDGGAGNDALAGGPGNDTLKGSGGRDWLLGGPGINIVMGGPGEDTLLGDPARNVLLGGPGRDRIQGRAAEHRNP
jgi:Big-like domain-containing protein/hemolysin type calcium-binding protein/ricin-type beta-trefoil lectin protein